MMGTGWGWGGEGTPDSGVVVWGGGATPDFGFSEETSNLLRQKQ